MSEAYFLENSGILQQLVWNQAVYVVLISMGLVVASITLYILAKTVYDIVIYRRKKNAFFKAQEAKKLADRNQLLAQDGTDFIDELVRYLETYQTGDQYKGIQNLLSKQGITQPDIQAIKSYIYQDKKIDTPTINAIKDRLRA